MTLYNSRKPGNSQLFLWGIQTYAWKAVTIFCKSPNKITVLRKWEAVFLWPGLGRSGRGRIPCWARASCRVICCSSSCCCRIACCSFWDFSRSCSWSCFCMGVRNNCGTYSINHKTIRNREEIEMQARSSKNELRVNLIIERNSLSDARYLPEISVHQQ